MFYTGHHSYEELIIQKRKQLEKQKARTQEIIGYLNKAVKENVDHNRIKRKIKQIEESMMETERAEKYLEELIAESKKEG